MGTYQVLVAEKARDNASDRHSTRKENPMTDLIYGFIGFLAVIAAIYGITRAIRYWSSIISRNIIASQAEDKHHGK